jgi:hypothetical protein
LVPALLLTACGTLEVGIEFTATPGQHVTATAGSAPTSTRPPATGIAGLLTTTPTIPPTPEPATLTPTPGSSVTPTAEACVADSTFVRDITIPDGAAITPGNIFVKTWRVRNSGTCPWGEGYVIIFVRGDRLATVSTAPIPLVEPGQVADISLAMTAPQAPGQYVGIWQLRSAEGARFGTTLTTEIVVPATPTPVPPPTPSPTPTPSRTPPGPMACAADFSQYPERIATFLDDPRTDLGQMEVWLRDCGVISENYGSVHLINLQKAATTDVVVAIHNRTISGPLLEGKLLIYHAGADGYTLKHHEKGERVDILAISDINADGKTEIVWTSTQCGAHSCVSQLAVDQWTGTDYEDWITGTPEMTSADYRLADTVADGTGQEILVHGGLIASAGAGPQRAWTETYISADGLPYTLFSQVYDYSSCLYHHILDANRAFIQAPDGSFETAITAYQDAINDNSLKACWTLDNELALLRDLARFRLVVAYTATGQPDQATQSRDAISAPALHGAADTFLESYHTTGSVAEACVATTAYAVDHPDAWQFMADWGYANPSFSAADLCPLE